jgi:hypothetical protein
MCRQQLTSHSSVNSPRRYLNKSWSDDGLDRGESASSDEKLQATSPLLFTFYSQFAALCRIWRDISVTVVILHSLVVFGCHTRRYCADVRQRLAAARGAINSLMAELMGPPYSQPNAQEFEIFRRGAEDVIEVVKTYLT